MNIKITSVLLVGLLCAASGAAYAVSGDGNGADATGIQSGATRGSSLPPDNTPGSPASGSNAGNGTGTSGGASGSGSGAGGGTGAAGGGTGGAGGGTGSWTHKSSP
ncbi:hypothetical protein [Pseudomonas sp. DR48]|uniref:hypothetical protein n=1 Tax=Pseudomonas sp. DR48 TaxID=2871095 RepID=UPI001C9935DA|nr:hypothetical protein [Pseudomonas sp. DR48]QZP30266.1 hypothetical protein K5K95_18755 [Pseudomonas sp. DR48]